MKLFATFAVGGPLKNRYAVITTDSELTAWKYLRSHFPFDWSGIYREKEFLDRQVDGLTELFDLDLSSLDEPRHLDKYPFRNVMEEARKKATEERQALTTDSSSVDLAFERLSKVAIGVRDERDALAQALRECLSHYCPGCGFGDEGCAPIHFSTCRFLALLEKAEGRKLKLNGEPE